MEIAKYLKFGKESDDRRIFRKWENGEITTYQAVKEFKSNNEIDEEIGVAEFERWVVGLGYTGERNE